MSDGHRPTDAPAPSRRSGPGRRVEAVRKNGGSRSDRTERPSRALRSTLPDPPAAPTRRKPAGQTSPAGHVPARAHGSPPPRSFDRTVRHDAGRVRRPTPWHLWMRAFRNPAIRSKCMPGWLPPDGAWACRHDIRPGRCPRRACRDAERPARAPSFGPNRKIRPFPAAGAKKGVRRCAAPFLCAMETKEFQRFGIHAPKWSAFKPAPTGKIRPFFRG